MHPTLRSTAFMALALLASAGALAAGDHGAGHAHPAAAGTPAIGQPGVAASATRTVAVDMNDAMRFTLRAST